ncbi:DUF1127 domain-containing protein [Salipiger sp.]|uniref:DUF1127 domain-containing protein n=1 Tax=Salipiger sp. TaxID=2078585 RepID=UPI003A9812EF
MSTYDTNRTMTGAAGVAGRIGDVFVAGFGAKSTSIDAPAAALAGRIGAFVAAVFNGVNDWHEARMTRKTLDALSDRELDDIGLCRGDIDSVARRY